MPFFQVDDQLAANAKAKALAEQALTGDLHGIAALGLWTLSGAQCQASLTDGIVTHADAIRILLNPQLAAALADRLVAVGLWHADGHHCARCPQPGSNAWVFHDWFDLGYDRGTQIKETRRKRRELKDAALVNAVWARDCLDPQKPTVAGCRYCGRTVNRNDRKGEQQATIDHVDPTIAVGIRNLVVSCKPCNQQKGRRTPLQAGMKLLPPPRPTADDPTAALAVSRPQRPAEKPQSAVEAPEVQPRAAKPADRPHSAPADPTADPTDPDRIEAVFGRTHARTRARAGSGRGQGEGPGEGQPTGSADQNPTTSSPRSRSRRRGRRGGKKRSSSQTSTTTSHPAGPAPQERQWDAGDGPVDEGAGRFGSPWHGWTGPPSEVADTVCAEHGQHWPCRICMAESETVTR